MPSWLLRALNSPLIFLLFCALISSPAALLDVILAGTDCLVAGDLCSSDETCSPRLRTLRQCVAGNGSMKLGPGARSQCANAVSALLSSPLHGCQCKRGMKKEKNCLSIYWSLHQSIIHGLSSIKQKACILQNHKYNLHFSSLSINSYIKKISIYVWVVHLNQYLYGPNLFI